MTRDTKRMGRWITIAVAVAVFCSSQALAKKKPPKPPPPDDPPSYTLVDLLGLTGGNWLQSEAHAVSEPDTQGTVFVAGNSRDAVEFRPVLWTVGSDGFFTEPEDLGGPMMHREADVNDAGVVVTFMGHVSVPGLPLQELPRLGADRAYATAINNNDQIVGYLVFDDGTTSELIGALWELDAEGVPSDPFLLIPAPPANHFLPKDISDTGLMAGELDSAPGASSKPPSPGSRPVIWLRNNSARCGTSTRGALRMPSAKMANGSWVHPQAPRTTKLFGGPRRRV